MPLVADLMASRWGYEAMAVFYFKNNSYELPFYPLDKIRAQAHYRAVYLADELSKRRSYIDHHWPGSRDSVVNQLTRNFPVYRKEITAAILRVANDRIGGRRGARVRSSPRRETACPPAASCGSSPGASSRSAGRARSPS